MIHAPEAPIFKALLIISSLLLIGTGLVARYLDLRLAKRLKLWIRLAAIALIASSLLDVGFTAYRALLELDPNLYGAYLTSSRHGQWVMARVAAAIVLWWLDTAPRAELQRLPRLDAWLHAVACFGLGLSLSMTTHVGATNEVLPIAGDLLHFFAMIVWVSSVAFLSFGTFTPKDGVTQTLRVSSIAVWCVGVLTFTGVYQAVLKLWSPALLLETQYGNTMTVKLLLYAIALVLAALNRFFWLPQLTRRAALFIRFQSSVRIELAVLMTIVLATATLGSTAPPERDVQLVAPVALKQTIGVWRLEAMATTPAIGGLRLEFKIIGQDGYKLESDARVDVNLVMAVDGMNIRQQPLRRSNGSYLLESRLGMPGEWKVTIQVPGARWSIPFKVRD